MQMEGAVVNSLLYVVPPFSREDRPGELHEDLLVDALGATFVQVLVRDGFIAKNIGAVSAPMFVITFYEEYSPRTTLMRDTMADPSVYRDVYSVTERGWRAVSDVMARGIATLPVPRWANEDGRLP